jgi:hypothetical protein
MKKKKNIRKKCEHDKRKDNCVKCSGCIHKKLVCIECTPNKFCEHKKRKSSCILCNTNIVCEHKKNKNKCKICNTDYYCNHNKRKILCIECSSGIAFCVHKKLKWNCVDCEGSQICIHKKKRKSCKECKGTDYCIHSKQKYFCIDCDGKGICEHKIRRIDCKFCSPEYYLISLLRGRTRYVLQNLGKTKSTIEYLGCSPNEFYEYIQSKMTPGMTLDNIHIDHIKPVSKFDFNNIIDIQQCCHWSNLQPLLIQDNLKKNNKWTEEDEKNWKNNIIKI